MRCDVDKSTRTSIERVMLDVMHKSAVVIAIAAPLAACVPRPARAPIAAPPEPTPTNGTSRVIVHADQPGPVNVSAASAMTMLNGGGTTKHAPIPGLVVQPDATTRATIESSVMKTMAYPSHVLVDADGRVVATSIDAALSELAVDRGDAP
jgi:hypothetical protein